ncbi:MAG: hypothetical protein JW902_12865 [Syntrophaceae bacterium]|nr:hypothetical protein [Syntrophaceae bacterium]
MQNFNDHLSSYITPDLGIAVYLFTLNHDLVKTTVISQRRLVFHFQRREDTDELVAKYLNGTGEAPAKKLFENYRALRGVAFSQTNNLR